MNGIVIYHEEMGIYIGSFLGLGFWSKMDPALQTHAVALPSEEHARQYISSWGSNNDPNDYTFHQVEVEEHKGCLYASIGSCTKAGLPSWEPSW